MEENFSEGDEAHSAFGVRGKRVATRMLELRMHNGEIFGIAYHWLQSLSFKPDHQIDMIFSTHRVQITGRNLKELYKRLLELRVPFVQQGHDFMDEKPAEEAFVSNISVKAR